MEGVMRQEAHILEDIYPASIQHRVLSLRRNEKDFLLRHDTSYVQNFNLLLRKELDYFRSDSLRYAKIIFRLNRYQAEFNKRCEIEEQIGLNSNSGIRHQLNQISRLLSNHFQGFNHLVNEHLAQVARSAIIYVPTICIHHHHPVIMAFHVAFQKVIASDCPIKPMGGFSRRCGIWPIQKERR